MTCSTHVVFFLLSRHVINKTNATRCCCLLANVTIIARERGSRIDDVNKSFLSTSVFVAFLLSYSLTLRQLRSYSLTRGSCSYSVTSNNRKRLLKIAVWPRLKLPLAMQARTGRLEHQDVIFIISFAKVIIIFLLCQSDHFRLWHSLMNR